MGNKSIFFCLSALLGVLAVMQNLYLSSLFLCLLCIFIKKRKRFNRKLFFLFLIIFALFYMRTEIESRKNITYFSGKESTFFLFFHEIGKIDGDQLSIVVKDKLRSEKLLLKYQIKSEEEKKFLHRSLSPGLICKVNGKLEEPSISTNPNAFHYQNYLKQNKIHWIVKTDQLNIRACQTASTPLTALKALRLQGILYLETYFPKDTVPLAAALLFGTDDLISEQIMDDYRDLGILHLLAISGLHIAIVVAIFYYVSLRLGMTREHCIYWLLFLLPVYCVLTGASPSVNRSILMVMILLVAKRWGQDYHFTAIDAIALTFLLYVFIAPYAIYNVGFQLSFSVTFTLLMSSSYILEKYDQPLQALFVTSFLSMLCSAPILLYYFYEFSIITLIVNLAYIPLFNLVLLPYILVAYTLHLLFGAFMNPLLYLLDGIIQLTNAATERISLFPWNTVVLGKPNVPMIFLYLWGIFLFLSEWEQTFSSVKRKCLLLFIPFCLFFIQYMMMQFPVKGEITFLDVGQGDSIYIRLPFGQGHYLIDTGGTIVFPQEAWQRKDQPYEVGRDTVVPFLKSKGVTKIDKLIITHGDFDHAGGAQTVLKELKVKELVLPRYQEKGELVDQLILLAETRKIDIEFIESGDTFRIGEASFAVLSPKEISTDSSNNGSIVLYTKLGGLKWLFTGDLEEEGERRLLIEYPNLDVDVLKVGHHGSNTSTTEPFLDAIAPNMAVISAGRNNRFGHPHEEVLQRLQKRNIKVLRTDENGAITYTFQKETGTFSVVNP